MLCTRTYFHTFASLPESQRHKKFENYRSALNLNAKLFSDWQGMYIVCTLGCTSSKKRIIPVRLIGSRFSFLFFQNHFLIRALCILMLYWRCKFFYFLRRSPYKNSLQIERTFCASLPENQCDHFRNEVFLTYKST